MWTWSREMAFRATMNQMDGVLLAKLLNWDGGGYCGTTSSVAKEANRINGDKR
jgi:hypothetical protein